MTKEAIDQIYEQARHGDVFAQVLMGQILIEGKYVQKDRTNGMGWLRNAAQCNCIYARDLLVDVTNQTYTSEQKDGNRQHVNGSDGHDYLAELNRLVGLDSVKKEVESLRNLIKIQAMRS